MDDLERLARDSRIHVFTEALLTSIGLTGAHSGACAEDFEGRAI